MFMFTYTYLLFKFYQFLISKFIISITIGCIFPKTTILRHLPSDFCKKGISSSLLNVFLHLVCMYASVLDGVMAGMFIL